MIICPQHRTGGEATQAMLIAGARRDSRLVACVAAAPAFLLDERTARALIDSQILLIRARFDAVCDEAGLSAIDRAGLRARQFLNDYAFEEY
jgi:serine/threonine-protein kinase HipA